MRNHTKPPESALIDSLLIFSTLLLCLFAISVNLNRLDWMGVSWLEHSDHWHIMQMAQSWLNPVRPQEPEIVYSRLPSIFPDGMIAVLAYILFGFKARSMYFVVILMLFSYVVSSLLLLRTIKIRVDCKIVSCIFLFTAMTLFASPSLTWSFVPVHHGGNIVSVILSLCFVIRATNLKKAFAWPLLFPLFSAGIFLFVLSNRFFLVSFVAPFLVLLILIRSQAYWLHLGCLVGSALALAVNAHMLRQGRDVIPGSDLSNFFPGAFARVMTTPVLAMLVLIFIYYVNLCLDSGRPLRFAWKYSSSPLRTNEGLFLAFSTCSLILGLIAEYTVSGIGNQVFNLRYVFGTLMLVPLLGVVVFLRTVPKRLHESRTLSFVMVGICLLGMAASGIGEASKAAQKNYKAALLLESVSLPTDYGLATYPYWQSLSIKGFSEGRYDVMDASSDGTPLFWYRWKGSLFKQKASNASSKNFLEGINGVGADLPEEIWRSGLSLDGDGLRGYKPYSFVFVSPYMQDRVEGHYGKPSRKIYCQEEGFDCLWIYDDFSSVLRDVKIFVDTYGESVKS